MLPNARPTAHAAAAGAPSLLSPAALPSMPGSAVIDVPPRSATPQRKGKPLHPVNIHFLGTCSGGGPITSRQCTATAVDFGTNIWLFDTADGTNNRLHQSSLRMVNISRIFITHMHADHVLGLVAILGVIMSGVGQTPAGLERLRQQGLEKQPKIHIYGPVGLRKFIRTILNITRITLMGVYAVHELIPEGSEPSLACTEEEIHINEGVGRDFYPNADGIWEDIVDDRPAKGAKGWTVSAGPLTHRVPSIGYVLCEPAPRFAVNAAALIPLLQANAERLAAMEPPVKHPLSLLSRLTAQPPPLPFTLPSGEVLYPPEPTGEPGRKIVIYGDCDGGTPNAAFEALCQDASLLVHECTNAAIPESVGKGDKGQQVRASGLEQSLEKKREREFERASKEKGVPREPWVFHKGRGDPTAVCKAVEEFAAQRDKVRTKARSRGHASPDEVGEFARAIRARRVAVNHFSAMFPSPRYASNEPFPSLLSPVSPFPYPTADVARLSAELPPVPLNARELHMRLIMQSLANQINAAWNGPNTPTPGPNELLEGGPHCVRLAVPARDFMVLRVPEHELTQDELWTMYNARTEAAAVMRSWAETGGVYVSEDGARRWVGVESEPQGAEDTAPQRS